MLLGGAGAGLSASNCKIPASIPSQGGDILTKTNFLEVIKSDNECRIAIECVRSIAFGRVASRDYTTSGELARWCDDKSAKSVACRVLKSDAPFLANHFLSITTKEKAEYLATQMGKPAGAFSASIAMAGHIEGIAPPAALLALVSQECKNSSELRSLLHLPEITGAKMLKLLLQAIELQQMPIEWTEMAKARPKTCPVPEVVTTEGSILSGLIQRCLVREQKAQEAWNVAHRKMEEATAELDRAKADTIAVVRASEIAEQFINK